MNYFEQELQKIVRCGVPFQSPTYTGSACFGRLDGDLRVRLQFVTLGHADHYTALKATVINRKDGAVDSALFRFADILGNKQVSNPNFKNGVIPYVWTYNGQSEWYVYHPKTEWSEATVQNILRNERYVGDALLQKTYVADCLTHRSVKNNGEHPQYYIRNNHAPIIERDIWNKTQEEIARRTCKRKAPSKSARTEISKYSGKYALNEVLVCGECGTPYRRVTWTKNKKRIVWRCISRLEHGTKHCRKSPTIPEEALHTAIMHAVSESILRAPLLEGGRSSYMLKSIKYANSITQR